MIKTPQKCKIRGLQKCDLAAKVKVKGHHSQISKKNEKCSEWLDTQK